MTPTTKLNRALLAELLRKQHTVVPMPMFNAGLYVGQVLIAVADAWWPEAAVVAEVDPREWHLSPADWEQTLRRHARLTAHGILVLHFTPRQIRTEPAQVVAAIRAALDAASRWPVPGAGAPGERLTPGHILRRRLVNQV
jgi:hypothetical protein